MKHKICPHCGASLDPEERCDCQRNDAAIDQTEIIPESK